VSLSPPCGIEVVQTESARDMQAAVVQRVGECTAVIKAAAVADYAPALRCAQKIKKNGEELSLQLVKTPDILAGLGVLEKRPLLVGFAAETVNLDEFAARKLKEKNADIIVANDVSQPDAGFNVDTNRARLLFRDGRVLEYPLMSKDTLASVILDHIAAELAARNP
jgi:phosphopantothenoylcysteine decarboxylase/phosphopantothenate--cysteine ligase